MYKDILDDLNSILEETKKVEKSFNLESKFKKNSSKKIEKDLDYKKIKEKIQQLEDGKASLEELKDLLKEFKNKDSRGSKDTEKKQ